MADKKDTGESSEAMCINGLTLITFGCDKAPTPELLAQLREMKTWGPHVIGKMVIHQIDKYLAQQEQAKPTAA